MASETLGRYRIDKELGRGAMGRVFLAFDPTIERRVAIKTIQIFESIPPSEQEQARERFLREARSAGQLIHPGIVTVFDVGEADGFPYLAMEYVEGETLDVFCREEALLPVEAAVEIVASAAEALAFAHARGIVHRDIKPANLMRVSERAAKIMDFGLAKNPAAQLTQDGALLGTPNYMSPEQIRGDALDGRSDLFSLTVVLFELLTGTKPFAGDTVSSVLYRIVHEPPRDPELLAGRVPAAVAEAVRRGLAKDPDARFRDGTEMATALRRAGSGAARGSSATPPAGVAAADATAAGIPRAYAAPRRSRWPWVVAAGLGLAIVAAAVVATRRGESPREAAPPVPAPAAPAPTAAVRTEPAGLEVLLDGVVVGGGKVPVPASGPFGTLVARQGCRTASHALTAEDAGREIVLVVDPVSIQAVVDPGVPRATLLVDGAVVGDVPATVTLDLCKDTRLEVRARGFKGSSVVIPAGATPTEARGAVGSLRAEALPKGRILLPDLGAVRFTIDGVPVERRASGIEAEEGTHEVRAVDEERWIDVRTAVEVRAGKSASATLSIPEAGILVVKGYPLDCSVFLRRGASAWRYIDDLPVEVSVPAGSYRVQVKSNRSGELQEHDAEIRPGAQTVLSVRFAK